MVPKTQQLVCLERLTLDWQVDGVRFQPHVPVVAASSSCAFVSESEWNDLAQSMPPQCEWTPGGNVGNALISYTATLVEDGYSVDAEWWGCYDNSQESLAALREMRELGVKVYGWCGEAATTRVLVLSSRDPREKALLVRLGRWPTEVMECSGARGYMLLLGLDSLADPSRKVQVSKWKHCEAVALMVNHEIVDSEDTAEVLRLVIQKRLKLLAGTEKELQALERRTGLVVGSGSGSWNCDVITTLGERGLNAFCLAEGRSVHVPAVSLHGTAVVSTLGAGDTIVGTFLAKRAEGVAFYDAICAAINAATEAIARESPRPAPGTLMRKTWEQSPIGSIVTELRDIRSEIDWGVGPTVISGGQTGIDQLALSSAFACALPSHAIYPHGLVTEHGPVSADVMRRIGNPRLYELPVHGYTIRTWATVFVADATLMWTNAESSGTIETRKACKALARPLFEISETSEENDEDCLRWLANHDVRILNVGGHRASLITDESLCSAQKTLTRLFRRWAEVYATKHPASVLKRLLGDPAECKHTRNDQDLILAIPSSGKMRQYALESLGITEHHVLSDRSLLTRSISPGLSIVSGRVRDMGYWLRHSLVDLAIGGLDELVEGDAVGKVLRDFGCFKSSILLLDSCSERTLPKSSAIVAQQPRLARRLLERYPEMRERVQAISGCAEAWARLGASSSTVDTWHTGGTARSNGLSPLLRLGETSLCLVGSNGIPDTLEERFKASASVHHYSR